MENQEDGAIDVVLCDKNPLILSGLSQLLSEDSRFNLVATASDGERFMDAVNRFNFQVGVIGWEMPFMNGMSVLKALSGIEAPPRVVIYTGAASPHVVRQSMQLGAAAFCSKSDAPDKLLDILLAVADGRMVFPFMDLRRRESDPLESLTVREHELLASLSRGLSNAQIASELDISLNTVKFHLKNLYEKLEVGNRAQAVACFLKTRAG